MPIHPPPPDNSQFLSTLHSLLSTSLSPRAAASLRVTSLEHFGDSLRVGLALPKSSLFLRVRRISDAPCFLKTPHLDISYDGDRLTRAGEHLLNLIAHALRNTTFDTLLRIHSLSSPSDDNALRARSVADAIATGGEWGLPDRWRQFFLESDVEDPLLTSDNFAFGPADSVLHHTDLECIYVIPPPLLRFTPHYNTFWGGRVLQDTANFFFTSLTEADIVMGSSTRLDAALDSLAARGPHSLLSLTCCCIPMMTADDIDLCVHRFNERCGASVVTMLQLEHEEQNKLPSLLRQTLDRSPSPKPQPHTYNLSGFVHDTATAELISILQTAGMIHNATVYPLIDSTALASYRDASLQVFYPLNISDPLYNALRPEMPAISPPPPCGIRATTHWLRTVADALNQRTPMQNTIDKTLQALRPEWNNHRNAASQFRLGFILSPSQFPLLTDPPRFTGIPLPQLIEEMGFGIDLLLFTGNEADSDPTPVVSLLDNPETLRVHPFNTPEQLDTLLRADTPHAIYSGITSDSRLTRRGKSPFSLADFELGYHGALRTLRRLLTLCRLPFFRLYAAHLGEPGQ